VLGEIPGAEFLNHTQASQNYRGGIRLHKRKGSRGGEGKKNEGGGGVKVKSAQRNRKGGRSSLVRSKNPNLKKRDGGGEVGSPPKRKNVREDVSQEKCYLYLNNLAVSTRGLPDLL